jgi:hypothetical protein
MPRDIQEDSRPREKSDYMHPDTIAQVQIAIPTVND